MTSYRGTGEPHPIDRIVGRNIRTFRRAMGMSQMQLASAIGITFQQIQKYESGANRCSASALYEIANAVDMPVESFFAGVSTEDALKASPRHRIGMEVMRRFDQLREAEKEAVATLLKAMSEAA